MNVTRDEEENFLEKLNKESVAFLKDETTHLTELEINFSSRNLTEIPYLDRVCNLSSKLTILDLSMNRINSLEAKELGGICKRNIKVLNLSHNQIEILHGINDLVSTIEELYLSYNRIKVLNSDIKIELINLRVILLDHNELSSVDNLVFNSRNLKLVDLSFNFINSTSIYFNESPRNMLTVKLNNNQLQEIPSLHEINKTEHSSFFLDLSKNDDLEFVEEFCNFNFSAFRSIKFLVTQNSTNLCPDLNKFKQVKREEGLHGVAIETCGLSLGLKQVNSHCEKISSEKFMVQFLSDFYHVFIYSNLAILVVCICIAIFAGDYSQFEDSSHNLDEDEAHSLNTKRLNDSLILFKLRKSRQEILKK